MNLRPKRLKPEHFQEVQSALVEFYSSKPEEYGLMERPQMVYEDYAKFIWRVLPDKNASVLDLGSGSWRIPDTIASYGYSKVVGLDYFTEEELLKNLKHITRDNATLKRYEADRIPFEDNSFDLVSSLCVLEHIVFVDNFFSEIDRVLKPGGKVVILCPNWSGVNAYVNGFFHIIFHRDRFWQLETVLDAIAGIFRSFFWYFENLLSKKPHFIMIYPRMKDGKVDFRRSDDDAVHLCQPLSIKKFFKKLGYKVIFYNRWFGTTRYTYFFNFFFPSLATTNVLVFQKPHLL